MSDVEVRAVGADEAIDEPISTTRLTEGLPSRPDPDLDRVLDATERCLTRFGLRRTTMSDIAREMGVARTTLYRQVSSVEEATALMSSRRLHRFLDKLLELGHHGLDAEVLVQVITRSVRMTLSEPLVQRLLHDEPEILGELLSSGTVARLVDQIAGLLAPGLAASMEAGAIRRSDPAMAADWIVRIVLGLTAVPAPDDDLEDTIRFVLIPLLAPDRS